MSDVPRDDLSLFAAGSRRLVSQEVGQTMAEYGLILALIALTIATAAMIGMWTQAQAAFTAIASCFADVASC